jgi:hypothetical protein
MEKNTILEQLRAAKAAHISWVQRAKLLIEGIEIDKNSIPVNSTECKFGQWFYGDAQKLNALRNNSLECMDNIENEHAKLHDIYLKIFKLYYVVETRGFFAKLFSNKKKLTNETIELGREYFIQLEQISKTLLLEISKLERRVIAIQDTEIALLS